MVANVKGKIFGIWSETYSHFRSQKKPWNYIPKLDQRVSMNNLQTKYLTQKEAAKYLGFAKSTVSMMTSRGELTHYRVGRSVRYTILDLDNYMQSRKIAGSYEESGRKVR